MTDPIKEVTFERTYDASPEAVWKAWTDPQLIKQWWGAEYALPETFLKLAAQAITETFEETEIVKPE